MYYLRQAVLFGVILSHNIGHEFRVAMNRLGHPLVSRKPYATFLTGHGTSATCPSTLAAMLSLKPEINHFFFNQLCSWQEVTEKVQPRKQSNFNLAPIYSINIETLLFFVIMPITHLPICISSGAKVQIVLVFAVYLVYSLKSSNSLSMVMSQMVAPLPRFCQTAAKSC